MPYEDVLVNHEGPVGWLTVNRPEKQNALRQRTFAELAYAAASLDADRDTRVIVLTGAGTRVFSAGIDLEHDGLPDDSAQWDSHTKANAAVLQRLWTLDTPLITAVNGAAIAAGCNLSLISDLTIAADNAFFDEPEIRHGALSPLLLLPWLTSFKAYNYMYLTGDRVDARRAEAIGLINGVVPADQLHAEAQRLAKRVANAPDYALTLARRAVRQTLDIMGFTAAQSAHRWIDTYLLASNGVAAKERLMHILAEDGLRAFLEARDRPYGER